MSSHHPMSHADAAWLRMDRATNLMVINSLMWFDEPPDWDRLRANYVERIVDCFPRFRQIARPGGPIGGAHWEDDPQFDPQDHFHRIALPAPHDRAALRALVADLADRAARPRAAAVGRLPDRRLRARRRRAHARAPRGRRRHRARSRTAVRDRRGRPRAGFGEHDAHRSALATVLHGGLSTVGHPRRAAARALTDLGTLCEAAAARRRALARAQGRGPRRPPDRVERPGRPVAGQAHRARLPRDGQRRADRGAVRRAARRGSWPRAPTRSACTRSCR